MSNSDYYNQSNLTKIYDKDMRDLFEIAFTTYKMSENYRTIYKSDPYCITPKRLIQLYTKFVQPDYNSMIYSFRKKYISNEVLVEKNDTLEQRRGLSNVYDYIQKFDASSSEFDIFISTLRLNSMLWEPTDNKNNSEFELELESKRKKIETLKEEAKKERNLVKLKKARELEKTISDMKYKSRIGGRLRSNDNEDNVELFDTDISVPKASESLKYMNSFLQADKKKEFNDALNNDDIISYIKYCVKETADLIYYQPFIDGNKRTFRSLLNLMFKLKGLPPVYIKTSEREVYKEALFKAMKEKDYQELVGFYLFKICDSIYELDVEPYNKKQVLKQRNKDSSN